MKTIKRIVAVVSVCALLFALSAMNVFAASAATVTVGSAEAKPGDTVKVDVVLSNCEKFSSYTISIGYDSQYVTAVSANEGIDVDLYMPNLSVDGKKELLVTGGSMENETENGVICTLEFSVSADYNGADFELPLKVNAIKMTQYDGSKDAHIESNGVDGKITVKGTGAAPAPDGGNNSTPSNGDSSTNDGANSNNGETADSSANSSDDGSNDGDGSSNSSKMSLLWIIIAAGAVVVGAAVVVFVIVKKKKCADKAE